MLNGLDIGELRKWRSIGALFSFLTDSLVGYMITLLFTSVSVKA